jgi:hypothetical protein
MEGILTDLVITFVALKVILGGLWVRFAMELKRELVVRLPAIDIPAPFCI